MFSNLAHLENLTKIPVQDEKTADSTAHRAAKEKMSNFYPCKSVADFLD